MNSTLSLIIAFAGLSAHAETNLNTARICLDTAIATGQINKKAASDQITEYASRVREINKIAHDQKTSASVNRARAEMIISRIQNDLAESAIPSLCVWNIESSISQAKELAANGNMNALAVLSQKTLKQLNQIASASLGEAHE